MSKSAAAEHIPDNRGDQVNLAMTKTETQATDPREFIRLLMENERRIYAYIFTLIGNRADAEDILQETSIVLWDKFSEFDRGADPTDGFVAWSFKVAFFTCQNFRRKQGRAKVMFSSGVAEAVAAKTISLVRGLDQRHEYLADCIKHLPNSDRDLLQLRYEIGASIETTAEKSGRSTQAIYKALSRMRAVLFDCVNRSMALESNS